MYLPRHFEQNDPAALAELMRQHPLATLVSQSEDGITADHIPLLYNADEGEHGTLVGHVARANPLWRRAATTPVLAIFSGAHAYVTPTWYESKATTHKVVPTWNYAVVHAHGALQAVEDATWLRALVSRLSDTHEAARPVPWSVNEAPDEFVQQMLRAIVGIRIPLTRLAGKWKISQNKSETDRLSIASGLDGGDAPARAMAEMMRNIPKETT